MYCYCGYGCDNKKQLSNHQRTKHPKVETSEISVKDNYLIINAVN